jgi:hypothetical protein
MVRLSCADLGTNQRPYTSKERPEVVDGWFRDSSPGSHAALTSDARRPMRLTTGSIHER